MSLQDDIARHSQLPWPNRDLVFQRIAAGLERDYYLVPLADLPEVETSRGESFYWSDAGSAISTKAQTEDAWAKAKGAIALAFHLQSRESEAARLEARRDRVVHEIYRNTYGDDVAAPGYTDAPDLTKTAVDSIVNLAEKLESGS